VLDEKRSPIPGLYAVGNDIASIMGGNYPGAGITLGPALTFGHIAGCHLAGVATGTQTAQAAEAANTSVDHDGIIPMGEVA
jgi:succinate dehydrogenase/fumarate reductase flavoprotein subunit